MNGKGKDNVNVVVDLEDQDDDWLLPPPKVSKVAYKSIEEDSTLKELRSGWLFYYSCVCFIKEVEILFICLIPKV